MKRVIFLSLMVLFSIQLALGQLSGKWETEIALLPSPALTSTSLVLSYAASSWCLASSSDFSSWGWVWQEFLAQAALGPFTTKGVLLFGPVVPAFLYCEAVVSTTLGPSEVEIYTGMLGAAAGGYLPLGGGPVGGTAVRISGPLGEGTCAAVFGLGATLPEEGFTLYHVSGLSKSYSLDPRPGGLRLTQVLLNLTELPLCCGLTYDAELSFTKAGFEYTKFTLKDVPLCCGISFDALIKFGVHSKEVTIKPYWEGVIGCFTVYGNALYDATNSTIGGVQIYGFKLYCGLGDCYYLEALTALANREYFWLLKDGTIVYDDEPPFPSGAEPLFHGQEFEVFRLGLCGPGCCGGQYRVRLATYFQGTGGLFGFSRVSVDLSVPLLVNLQTFLKFSTPPTVLSLGWSFSF